MMSPLPLGALGDLLLWLLPFLWFLCHFAACRVVVVVAVVVVIWRAFQPTSQPGF